MKSNRSFLLLLFSLVVYGTSGFQSTSIPVNRFSLTTGFRPRSQNGILTTNRSQSKLWSGSVDARPSQTKKTMIRSLFRRMVSKTSKAIAAFAFVFACFVHSSNAAPGGRMGGSFRSSGRSSGAPMTRMYGTSARTQYYPRHYPPHHTFTTGTRHHVIVQNRFSAPPAARRTLQDNLILGGTGVLLAYGFYNGAKQDRERRDALSTTVASVTVCLDVADQTDENSIIARLKSLSRGVDSENRESVQKLVGDVVLEILRNRASISAATAVSEKHDSSSDAERGFQKLSIEGRSKFDRESINKFGKEVMTIESLPVVPAEKQPTKAVVTINVMLDGDTLKLRPVKFRSDLEWSLMSLSQNCQAGDRLVSAEILWAPESQTESLSDTDIYANYPNLVPL